MELAACTRLVVFPRFLTPYRPRNTTSRDFCPPSSRDPYPPRAPSGHDPYPRPLPHLFGKGKLPARQGVPARGFLGCGRFGRGNATSRGPSRAGTPCLSPQTALSLQRFLGGPSPHLHFPEKQSRLRDKKKSICNNSGMEKGVIAKGKGISKLFKFFGIFRKWSDSSWSYTPQRNL